MVSYIKERRSIITLLFLCFLIFLTAFWLYHLPIKAVLYPSALCLLLFCIRAITGSYRLAQKHKWLKRLLSLPDNLCDMLSIYSGLSDQDYQNIIHALCEREKYTKEQSDSMIRDMDDYYTTWVHQIKTPIASMQLCLQNEDTPLSRRLSGDLFRIGQYVDMVLAYIRMGSNTTDYVFKSCSLDDIIKSALRKYSGQFIGKGLRLNYKEINQIIVTDEKWLGFVLEQVLSNAIKYTEHGTVSIYMERSDTLCIRDTGIGIAPENLPRIFEKGYTGNNGRLEKKASGLGLYLCSCVCNNIGADIYAESPPEGGSIIKIHLGQNRE